MMKLGEAEQDYYETLQVHEKALAEIIDKAYRVLVRRYHPDVHPPGKKSWAQAKMTQLNIAYDVLSDAARRAEYDALRRYGPGRRRRPDDAYAADASGEITLKCFNHPKRASVKFCWHCGRPICAECLAGERHGRTVCLTCADVLDREAMWRAGETPDLEERKRKGKPMGAWGLVLYYGFLAALLAVVCWAVGHLALTFGTTPRQAWTLSLVLALVFLILLVHRLTWRVICPRCHAAIGHGRFRATAPWGEFLAPQPICPSCGRRFRMAELTQTFD
jgi:hypothetical protein